MEQNPVQKSAQNLNPISSPIPQQASQAPIQNLNQNQTQIQDEKSINTKFISLGIFLGVIVLILIIAGIYFFLNPNKFCELNTNNNETNLQINSNLNSEPDVKINVEDVDPHQLAIELYEKAENIEYVYYKIQPIYDDEISEYWHYNRYSRKESKNNIAILTPKIQYLMDKKTGKVLLQKLDNAKTENYREFNIGILFSSFIKDNPTLKLENITKDRNGLSEYEFSLKNPNNDKLVSIWFLENGFMTKIIEKSQDQKSVSVTEFKDYSFTPFPLSIFDVPK